MSEIFVCDGKKKHKSLAAAVKAKRRTSGGHNMCAYLCRFCKYFHIGHKPKYRKL